MSTERINNSADSYATLKTSHFYRLDFYKLFNVPAINSCLYEKLFNSNMR